jgi:hypothetical protein
MLNLIINGHPYTLGNEEGDSPYVTMLRRLSDDEEALVDFPRVCQNITGCVRLSSPGEYNALPTWRSADEVLEKLRETSNEVILRA